MRIYSPLAFLLLLLAACGGKAPQPETPGGSLELVAESARQWTGVAVAPDGRIFVNFPRWSDDVPVSVAELVDGEPVPYPSPEWNAYAPGEDPATHFVCVQSVTVDDRGYLWILDPANPRFQGVVPGGPKLLKVDLATNEIVETFRFGENVAVPGAYLNDVRIDTGRGVAYLSESGVGALVVLDLATGASRRLLDGHPSVRAEPIDLVIGGAAWQRGGKTPQVHADGIALSPDRRWIYFQALTGRTLYRVPTEALRDPRLGDDALAATVERVATSGASDGLAFDPRGFLYLSSLEEDAVNRLTPDHVKERVVHDPRLAWPDSFAVAADGSIYVTTAQIHLGASPADPYRLWRIRP